MIVSYTSILMLKVYNDAKQMFRKDIWIMYAGDCNHKSNLQDPSICFYSKKYLKAKFELKTDPVIISIQTLMGWAIPAFGNPSVQSQWEAMQKVPETSLEHHRLYENTQFSSKKRYEYVDGIKTIYMSKRHHQREWNLSYFRKEWTTKLWCSVPPCCNVILQCTRALILKLISIIMIII